MANTIKEQISQHIDLSIKESLELAAQVMAINSHSSNVTGINRVQDIFDDQLTALGLQTKRYSSEAFGDHLTATNAPGRKGILIVGHADTAHAQESNFQKVTREGDQMKGPGGYDMKAGVVMMLLSLSALKKAGVLENIPIHVLIIGDEEIGMPGSTQLHFDMAAQADAGLVLESGRPSNLVISSRKGLGTFSIYVRGKAAHSGNHYWEGSNAIVQLAHTLLKIAALSDYDRNLTFNVGQIQGGTSPTIVAESATARFDIRVCSNADYEWGLKELESLQKGIQVPGTSISIQKESYFSPMERIPGVGELVERYIVAAGEAGIESLESPKIIGGGSSANLLSGAGLPTIDGLGPFGDGMHTDLEWFSVESLKQKSKTLALMLAGFAK